MNVRIQKSSASCRSMNMRFCLRDSILCHYFPMFFESLRKRFSKSLSQIALCLCDPDGPWCTQPFHVPKDWRHAVVCLCSADRSYRDLSLALRLPHKGKTVPIFVKILSSLQGVYPQLCRLSHTHAKHHSLFHSTEGLCILPGSEIAFSSTFTINVGTSSVVDWGSMFSGSRLVFPCWRRAIPCFS